MRTERNVGIFFWICMAPTKAIQNNSNNIDSGNSNISNRNKSNNHSAIRHRHCNKQKQQNPINLNFHVQRLSFLLSIPVSFSRSLSVCVSFHICNTNSWLVSFGLSFLALGLGARNYILCKVIIVHRVEMQPIVWLCLARIRQMQQYHFNIRMQL